MSASRPGRPSDGWATANDWATHRPLITALYREQNKTLKETMQIMEEKHSFFATVRMYKARFQQWGIEKKIKAEDAVEIFRQQTARAKAGKSSVAYVRGRKISSDRLQRYRYRAAAIVSEQILMVEKELATSPSELMPASSHVICRTPSPGPEDSPTISPQLEDPTDFKIPHECMQILKGYIAGSIEARVWQPSDPAKYQAPDAFTWAHYLATSQGLISHNRTKEGFILLGVCFEQYKSHIRKPDPFFWLATYKAALLLAHRDRKLGEAFINYASSLTSVILPRAHPFNRVWSRIMVTGLTGLQQHAAALFESYLNAWKQEADMPPTDQASLEHLAFIFIQLQCNGMISYSFTRETLEAMMGLLSQSISSQFLLQEAKFRMTCLFLEQGKLDEADAMTNEIITWLDSLPKSSQGDYSHLRCKCLWTVFEIKDKKGINKEATEAGFALIKLCHDIYGPIHLQTIDAISAVESFHSRNNNLALARKMSGQFDERWSVFYDIAQANNGFPHTIEKPWFHRCIELEEHQRLIQQVIDLFERSTWLEKP
ncbi:hypothetical protein F5Y19DRAFT_27410 [Xylariaceae sp. FL1651]|nr:hypothetical protein F5Y19DRAFT_27410 [Xylariaceae sp. FL1651]